jgi:hypothetical protein
MSLDETSGSRQVGSATTANDLRGKDVAKESPQPRSDVATTRTACLSVHGKCTGVDFQLEFDSSADDTAEIWFAKSEAAAANMNAMRDFIKQPVHIQGRQSAAELNATCTRSDFRRLQVASECKMLIAE